MGRALRLNVADGIFHIGARGVRKLPIYEDAYDYRRFEGMFRAVVRDLGWTAHAHCLMPNHYHLVAEIRDPNLSTGMHRLNWRFANWFNARHEYAGHLFDRRFYSELVEDDAYFVTLVRYVLLNPVRARLCGHPGDWPYSSYRAPLSDRLVGEFGGRPAEARSRFERFVAAGVSNGRVPVPGTGTRLDQPKPYVPAKRSASRRTSVAAGSPTTLR